MQLEDFIKQYLPHAFPLWTSRGRLSVERAVISPSVTLTYTSAVAMTINAALGNDVTLTITDGVAFTINAPTNPVSGQKLTLTVRNTSGGVLGAATFNVVFKQIAWVPPATGNSRSLTWRFDGTNWVQITPETVDVPN